MTNTKWNIDPSHSELTFKIKHLMMTNVTGHFGSFTGSLESSGATFTDSKVQFTAQIASINTKNDQRDAHLRSPDFFDADKHPSLTFVSEHFTSNGGNDYSVSGMLTIKGISQKIVLAAEYEGTQKDPWGNEKVGFSLSAKINRKDFGLSWNAPLEAGGLLVGEEVKISAEIQLVKA